MLGGSGPADAATVALGSSGSWGPCQERLQEMTKASAPCSFLCGHPGLCASLGCCSPLTTLQSSPRSSPVCG